MTNSNGPVMKGIVNSWSLISFARSHGKMQIGEFTSKDTGEIFKSCVFTDPNDQTRTFVSFSSKLGTLTPKEIVEQKDALQVVELEGGNYSLCKAGANAWEDVDLEL